MLLALREYAKKLKLDHRREKNVLDTRLRMLLSFSGNSFTKESREQLAQLTTDIVDLNVSGDG